MFRKRVCQTCEVLKQENEYLRKLIDRLLAKSNVAPVELPKEETPAEKSEFEKIIETGGEVYGAV